MATRYFCTLFDSGYLLKGLAMICSLARCCPDMKIHVLCMDVQTKFILKQLGMPFINIIDLADIEDDDLFSVKAKRGGRVLLDTFILFYVVRDAEESRNMLSDVRWC